MQVDQQNNTFKNNQRVLCEELDGKMRQEMPDAEESISKLWEHPRDYDRNAEWIMIVEKELERVTEQGNINITKEDGSIHLGEGYAQIGKRYALMDYIDSASKNLLLFIR